jgi:hypothetical protein
MISLILGAITMMLFAMAVAQAVQTMQLPAVRPAPPVSGIVVAPPTSDIRANLLPDLVVADIRIENDDTAWVRLANQGTGNAVGPIPLTVWAHEGSSRGQPAQFNYPHEGLAAGEAEWVKVYGFRLLNPSYAAGADNVFHLAKANGIAATVDPKVSTSTPSGNWGVPGSSVLDSLPRPGKPRCNEVIGCIRELNEDNNELQLEGDAVVHGAPDKTSSTERG